LKNKGITKADLMSIDKNTLNKLISILNKVAGQASKQLNNPNDESKLDQDLLNKLDNKDKQAASLLGADTFNKLASIDPKDLEKLLANIDIISGAIKSGVVKDSKVQSLLDLMSK